ncbi:hypothetical protein [Modestobacter sp. Leaf380]|uniref:hypothetical protein n=1 Tax=Modestobacter sp. Leaf380 TaxID=1736356 RepID=UPI0006FAA118|nr:hypothetical protein [Modestobacter sp. Leaf380]KQS68677.1 hypothetical protein ASG41_07045 [Modestobacter sp. Leaf380]
MTTAEPVRPAVTTGVFGTSRVQASVLASFQLVEDARYRTPDHVRKRQRARFRAEQAVAARLVAREFERE